MINREVISEEWSEKVVPVHPVPPNLFPHQLDTMAFIKEGKNIFLGILSIVMIKNNCINEYFLKLGVPTGSGKTLPQLATILTMPG